MTITGPRAHLWPQDFSENVQGLVREFVRDGDFKGADYYLPELDEIYKRIVDEMWEPSRLGKGLGIDTTPFDVFVVQCGDKAVLFDWIENEAFAVCEVDVMRMET